MSQHEDASAKAIDVALETLHADTSTERTYKTDRDYATATDLLVEDRLRTLLHDLTPDLGFLGEERGHTGSTNSYWCLDPIDGTTNFTRGLPIFGVSLALVDEGTPTHGEIALAALHERYVTRGGDAYCNGARLSVSDTHTLSEVLATVGDFATGAASRAKNRDRISTLTRLADRVGRVRMLGSAAADLAWLAAGRIDAVITHSNKPWDMAAGIALAHAAGAGITHHDGSPYTLNGPDLLAAPPGVHELLLSALNDATL